MGRTKDRATFQRGPVTRHLQAGPSPEEHVPTFLDGSTRSVDNRPRSVLSLGVMSRDVVESVEGYAANRRVVSVVVVEVEPAGQRQASFGL